MSAIPGAGARRALAGNEPLVLALTVAAVVLLHVLQLRAGHDWSDDYAMYVSHALNLLAGRPYADTGFIPNPWAVPGPATYPPVYPLMIVPILAIWGQDLQVLKVFGVVMLGAALVVAYFIWRPRVGRSASIGLVLLLGLNPFLVGFRDEVRPDTAFMFFFLATLWLGDRWAGHTQGWTSGVIVRGIVLGLLAYLAYGTRSIGLVLLPALWLVDLARLRRPTPTLLTASAVFCTAAVLQSALLHSDTAYAGNLTLDPATLAYNSWHYFTSLSVFWVNGVSSPWGTLLRAALFGIILLLAAVGYIVHVRRGVSVFEVVPWLYVAPLILYWVGTMIQQRYLLPLFPLVLSYAWTGATILRGRVGATPSTALLALTAALLCVAYASGHAKAEHSEIRPGSTDPEAREVFDWLRGNTPTGAVVLVGRARAFALNTGRACVSPFGYRTDAELWRLIRDQRVTHLVAGVGPTARDMDYEHPDDMARFVAANPQRIEMVLGNRSLRLYRVMPPDNPGSAR